MNSISKVMKWWNDKMMNLIKIKSHTILVSLSFCDPDHLVAIVQSHLDLIDFAQLQTSLKTFFCPPVLKHSHQRLSFHVVSFWIWFLLLNYLVWYLYALLELLHSDQSKGDVLEQFHWQLLRDFVSVIDV